MVAHFCMNDCSRDFISLYVCGSFIRSNWKFHECAQNHKISAVENGKKKSLPSTLGKTFTFEECNGYIGPVLSRDRAKRHYLRVFLGLIFAINYLSLFFLFCFMFLIFQEPTHQCCLCSSIHRTTKGSCNLRYNTTRPQTIVASSLCESSAVNLNTINLTNPVSALHHWKISKKYFYYII